MEYFAEIIENRRRVWGDYKTFAVWTSGPGEEAGEWARKLAKGDLLYASLWPKGCVGLAKVTGPARPAREVFTGDTFEVINQERKRVLIPMEQNPFLMDDPDELVVPISWLICLPKNKPHKMAGMQHSDEETPLVEITDPATRKFFQGKFQHR